MSDALRIAAIVPVAAIEGAKTRLGESLDAEERHDLVERLVARTLEATGAVASIADVLVISPDRTVLAWAAEAGARTLRQRSSGLNEGIREARADVLAGAANAILIVPIDLPFITPADLEDVLTALLADPRPTVVAVADRHGTGTNALGLRPPEVIEVAFGPDSLATHRVAAIAAGARFQELAGPLSVDLDTPEDLVLVDAMRAEGSRAG